MKKYFLSGYFSFTKKERVGIIAILVLILILVLTPFLYPLLIPQKKYDPQKFDKEIAMLKNSGEHDSNDSKGYFSRKYDNDTYQNRADPSFKKEDDRTNSELFYFDPNTLNKNGWERLGVKSKTIQTIQKYLSKGGRFYKPDDIGKILGLSDEMVQRLMPYINIEQSKDEAKQAYKDESYNNVYKPYVKAQPQTIDINTADTNAFIALPFIAGKLANRIVMFRSKLGGFYNVDQIGEVYGVRDSIFQIIKPRLSIGNGSLIRININTAPVDEMKMHPYIRYALANAIVQYRTQHGNFSAVADIKKIMLVTDDVYNKLYPYLKVSD